MAFDVETDDAVINTNIGIERAAIFTAISVGLVFFGGITSGLNVSLLSLHADKHKARIELAKQNPDIPIDEETKMMTKIQPLINDRHLLLVTILIANATCMEALPIFLDELVATWLAVVISVTFVLIFGEILPQALLMKDPLKSGYKMYYVVVCMKWILYPICRPIAFVLDLLLGKEHKHKGVVFSQKEVKEILTEIQKHMHPDEKTVVEGAFKIANCKVQDSWIPWDDVVCCDANTKLDGKGLLKIYKMGLSRIPLYEDTKDNVIGLLLVKSLILCDPDPNLTVKDYLINNFHKVRKPAIVFPDTLLYDCLNIFQAEKTHLAMVCKDRDAEVEIQQCWKENTPLPQYIKWFGIITLEDIMEGIIQEDLIDEFDREFEAFTADADDAKCPTWTDDKSFVESVTSRLNAKHKRTQRAKHARLKQQKSNEALLEANKTKSSESIAIKEMKPSYGSVQVMEHGNVQNK